MDDVAGHRKAQIKMFTEENKAKASLVGPWRRSRGEQDCHGEGQSQGQAAGHLCVDTGSPGPSTGHAEHQQLDMLVTLDPITTSPSGELRKVFWENLNSLKEKTVTHTDTQVSPSARLPPSHPTVKSSD